jgi:hypothetical protein
MAIGCMLISAQAKELFEGEKEPVLIAGQYINSDSTIGGYQIYQGGQRWTYHSGTLSWSGGRADSIPLGELMMSTWAPDGMIAVQSLDANLRINNGAYWSGEPCSGTHLARRNLNRGRDDNCMVVDALEVPIANQPKTFLRMRTVQSASSGRYYAASLMINADYLGADNVPSSEWTAETVQTDPKKASAFKKFYTWAERYQDAAAQQMDFRKPADTFVAVPDLRVLKAAGPKPAIDESTKAKVNNRSKSWTYCETSKSMINEADGYCPATAVEAAANPSATKNGRAPNAPVAYVFCEATKSMEPEGLGNCLAK